MNFSAHNNFYYFHAGDETKALGLAHRSRHALVKTSAGQYLSRSMMSKMMIVVN